MRRSLHVSLSGLAAALLGVSSFGAEETSPVLKERRPAPAPQITATAPTRAISPETAAKLLASTPKFSNTPTGLKTSAAFEAPPGITKPIEPGTDLREIDKPRNTIIRLPSYVVQEMKTAEVKERDVLTPSGRLDLALRRHPGLRLGSFWIFRNDGIALAMLAEEERLEKIREFQDLASLMQFSSADSHATVKHEVDRAFLRTADFGR